jgi:predicted TIM-barrel fold metal-dependent hydrolase
LNFAGEVGLVVIIHNDMDVPFARIDTEPVYLTQMKALLRRHPNTTIIWAHTGLGRVVHPSQASATEGVERNPNHLELIESILADPAFSHVYFDISWDEVAKYVNASPEVQRRTAEIFNRYPNRFLFGTDVVAPADSAAQLQVFHLWDDVFSHLTPEASFAIRRGNYERLFDAARTHVRAWEAANVRRR